MPDIKRAKTPKFGGPVQYSNTKAVTYGGKYRDSSTKYFSGFAGEEGLISEEGLAKSLNMDPKNEALSPMHEVFSQIDGKKGLSPQEMTTVMLSQLDSNTQSPEKNANGIYENHERDFWETMWKGHNEKYAQEVPYGKPGKAEAMKADQQKMLDGYDDPQFGHMQGLRDIYKSLFSEQ